METYSISTYDPNNTDRQVGFFQTVVSEATMAAETRPVSDAYLKEPLVSVKGGNPVPDGRIVTVVIPAEGGRGPRIYTLQTEQGASADMLTNTFEAPGHLFSLRGENLRLLSVLSMPATVNV